MYVLKLFFGIKYTTKQSYQNTHASNFKSSKNGKQQGTFYYKETALIHCRLLLLLVIRYNNTLNQEM